MIAMTTTANATISQGVILPEAGTWDIDPSHSTVGCSVKHLGIARTRGRFGSFSGTVEVAERPEASRVDVAIEAASVDTRDETRDEHLRSDDFFAVAEHPELRFVSTGVQGSGERWTLDGDLTIRGVTRPVSLDVTYEGGATDPWGGTRAGFTARTEVDREAWGLTWNAALETGGLLVGKKVAIELEVELVKRP